MLRGAFGETNKAETVHSIKYKYYDTSSVVSFILRMRASPHQTFGYEYQPPVYAFVDIMNIADGALCTNLWLHRLHSELRLQFAVIKMSAACQITCTMQ